MYQHLFSTTDSTGVGMKSFLSVVPMCSDCTVDNNYM